MADPVVHLTGGIPDSGTGNITTLGMLLPVAKTANPTAATDGVNVAALFDKLGKQVVVGSLRDLKDSVSITITSSTAAATLLAGIASIFTDIYGLIITNINATTATEVIVSDGTKTYSFMAPAGETRGLMLPEGGGLKASAVGTTWTAQTVTSVASVKITALYVKNV